MEQLRVTPKKPVKIRGKWANKTEFILSCLGYAIGIGNVWRFPYLCYRNGGGAFLVPYLIMLFLCGIPLFFLETSLGQFANTGFITVFKIAPIFKGVGFAIVLVNVICTTYFNVIIAYPIVFLYNCLQEKLPWLDCNNTWNTPNCLQLSGEGKSEELVNIISNSTGRMKTPADEFFHNKILQISHGVNEIGSIVWPVLFSDFLVWTIVFFCIMYGAKSVGKVVYFTATFPFIILFILLIRGVTLPGAIDGIIFYIYPQWDQLLNLKVWADAACQIFFSLGPGWGGIINMASYNEFKNNIKNDAILVPIINCGTSIFAGFVVFSVLGFMSYQTGLPVSSVATGGPSLAYVTYPEAITMLPWSRFWAVLFFVMLFLLGLDTCFVQTEAIISSVMDEFPILRRNTVLVTFLSCLFMFICSILFVTNGGMYYLQLFDWYAASISVILICFIEVFIVGWTYGMDNFLSDIEFMIGVKVSWWWKFCWKYATPTILSVIFVTSIVFNTTITYHGIVYPEWAIKLGWTSCLVSILCIPAYIIYYLFFLNKESFLKGIRLGLKPSKEWGPASSDTRKEWKYFRNNGYASTKKRLSLVSCGVNSVVNMF